MYAIHHSPMTRSPLANNSFLTTRMIFRALPERLSEAEIDEMLRAADTDGDNP